MVANTRKESSLTKPSTTDKGGAKAWEITGPLPGLTRMEVLFLAATTIEGQRMAMVRDGSPDPDQFKKNYKMLDLLYKDIQANGA